MAKVKNNSNEILHLLVEKATENGYSLIVNGTDSEELQLVLYPFRETVVSQEQIARQLYEIIADSGVTANKQSFQRFKEEIEPDDIEHHAFVGESEDNSNNETRISVFHNKNLLLKYIKIRLC